MKARNMILRLHHGLLVCLLASCGLQDATPQPTPTPVPTTVPDPLGARPVDPARTAAMLAQARNLVRPGSVVQTEPRFGVPTFLWARDAAGTNTRAPINGLAVYPRPEQDPLPVWVAVGGNTPSAARAGLLGLPMALAIIGGYPERFAPLAELHRRALTEGGHGRQPLSINSHGFIAATSQEAVRTSFPAFKAMMDRIGRERGWPPLTREQYLASHELRGANFVGSPDQIVEKILFQHEIFHHDRFLLQMSVGTLGHQDVMRAIELLGTEVAPKVRAALAPQAAKR